MRAASPSPSERNRCAIWLALADHSLVDSIENIGIVIYAFEPDIEQINAELRQFLRALRFDFLFDFHSSILNRREHANCSQTGWHIFQAFVPERFAFLVRAHNLDQIMFGHGVAGLASKNVFQTRLGASFIAQPHEKGLGVGDAPAGKSVDMNVGLVPRRDGNGGTIPFEKTLIDSVDLLNDGNLEMQSRFPDWFSDRFAELRDDHLFGLVNGVEASEQRPQNRARSAMNKNQRHPRLLIFSPGGSG